MTQKKLILEYVDEYRSILPAKIAGKIYKGVMFGSETSKRCRELRKAGMLNSHSEGKFTVYTRRVMVAPVFQGILDNISPLQRLFPGVEENLKRMTILKK